ncbi:MAG: hypothetical protein ACRDH7_09230 [Actinomycetota bacterium]
MTLTPLEDWGHEKRRHPAAYEDTPTYRLAAGWLDGRHTIEDWGCGTAWARQFYTLGQYRGLDGTGSRFCDEVVDLRTYRSEVACITMRHVLEHNWDWRLIAQNFAASWTHRAALALFIPPQPDDFDAGGPEWPIPDVAVGGADLIESLDPRGEVIFESWQQWEFPHDHPMQWGWEGLLLMSR